MPWGDLLSAESTSIVSSSHPLDTEVAEDVCTGELDWIDPLVMTHTADIFCCSLGVV